MLPQFSFVVGERNQVLYHQGDPARTVQLLLAGSVRLSRLSADGRELTVAILAPGDVFGDDAVFDASATRFAQATCLLDAQLLTCPVGAFRALLDEPVIARNVARLVHAQRDAAYASIETMALLSVRDRIMNLLERFAPEHGTRTRRGVRINVRLTRSQVALLIGSTRETVSMEISRLVRSGRLRTTRRHFVLPPDELTSPCARSDRRL